jgi:hypothetical protein
MANYFCIDQVGDHRWISTHTSSDGVERIVREQVAYASVHGSNASIGGEWEYAVNGEDEYASTVAQTWVDSLEGVGDVFNSADFASVQVND